MYAAIKDIAYYLPENKLTNEDLIADFPEWTVDKIYSKTGVSTRHIAAKDETALDMGYCAAVKLFDRACCLPSQIEFILFCTQSNDYLLPTTACILQTKLRCLNAIGALDFNQGCSGFVYGLSLAKGLIESGQVRNVLLITAETYSKYIPQGDKATRTIFGDGAAATFIEGVEADHPAIYGGQFGTDGKGARNLIVEGGGARCPTLPKKLYMNGSEIFVFTLRVIPEIIAQTLSHANLGSGDIDYFIFHQANRFMLDHLRAKLNIPSEKFILYLEDVGNTVSSTIPIAIFEAISIGVVKNAQKVMLVGYGVGYSWATQIVDLSYIEEKLGEG